MAAGKNPLMRMPTMLMGTSSDALLCTYAVTGTKPVAQRLYECHTCGFTEANGSVICVTCAAVCHRGHHVVYRGFHNSAYCDCGSSPKPGVCQALKPLQFAPHASQSQTPSQSPTHQAVGGAAGAAGKGAGAPSAPPSFFDGKQQASAPAAAAAAPVAAREYCSFSVSGTRPVRFASGVYECQTCAHKLPTGSVLCPLCARTCHAGHALRHINSAVEATCDCGADPSLCRALPPKQPPMASAAAAAGAAPLMIGAPVMVGGGVPSPVGGMTFVPTTAAGLAAAQAAATQSHSATASAAAWAANFMGGGVGMAVPVAEVVPVAGVGVLSPHDGGAPPSFLGRAPSFGEALPPPPDFVDLTPASAAGAASASAPASAPAAVAVPPKYASVAEFLRGLDLSELLSSFVAQDVDLPTLLSLSADALRDLIPRVGPRAKVAAKLDELRLKQALAAHHSQNGSGAGHPQHGGAAAVAAAQAAAQAAAAAKLEVALNMYRDVVARALEDGKATSKDQKMLGDLRAQYAITDAQHAQVLRGLQLSDSKWDDLKRAGAHAEAEAAAAAANAGAGVAGNECVVCLDAKADHILLPCAHICLCGGCSGKFQPNAPCPKCRTPIASVRKVFTS